MAVIEKITIEGKLHRMHLGFIVDESSDKNI